jgi:hypothetical protein
MKTQKQTNLLTERALEAGETLYEIAQTKLPGSRPDADFALENPPLPQNSLQIGP